MNAAETAASPVDVTAWRCDPYTEALARERGPLFLRRPDGSTLPLDVERWCGGIDAADAAVLERCEGGVLDVGCGPGRLVAALADLGRPALGVDLNPLAVAHANASGGRALCQSAFDPVPEEGGWHTALLIDGNIGIGGSPERLLSRVRELVLPGGLLIAEAAPEDVCERMTARITDGRGGVGAPFPWARLGLPALLDLAERTGWSRADTWEARGRRFAALRSGRGGTTAGVPRGAAVPQTGRPPR